MRKIILVSLLVVGLISVLIVAALVRDTADNRSGSVPRQKNAEPGYISKITASGVQIDLELRSTDTRTRSVPVGARIPKTEASPGTYKPQNITLQAMQDGDRWQMVAPGSWGEVKTIRVESGVTTELKVGPPLTVKTDVAPKGEGVSVGLSIFGQAGECYHPGVRKNNQRQPAPALKIIDEAVKVLATGKFEYG